MRERTIELYNDSFERCLSQAGFLPRFYELFLNSSPQVREKFKHTDFKQQVRIVKKSLYTLTMASTGTQEAEQEIQRLRHTHGGDGLQIVPELYDLWLNCLLQTVKEFDKNWTPEVESSWRDMLAPHLVALKCNFAAVRPGDTVSRP